VAAEDLIQLQVILGDQADDESAIDSVLHLRSELADLDIEAAELVAGNEPPASAKGLEGAAVGELLVVLRGSAQLLRTVVMVVRDWLARSDVPRVRMVVDGDLLEITRVSDRDMQVLVDAWVERHARQ
jgi:hypothetical protein